MQLCLSRNAFRLLGSSRLISMFGSPKRTTTTLPLSFFTYTLNFFDSPEVRIGSFNFTFLPLYSASSITFITSYNLLITSFLAAFLPQDFPLPRSLQAPALLASTRFVSNDFTVFTNRCVAVYPTTFFTGSAFASKPITE